MVESLASFISSAADDTGYKKYSEKLWATGGEIDSPAPQLFSHKDLGIAEDLNPAQKFMELSKQLTSLAGRMTGAEVENDPNGIGLANLIKEFSPQKPKEQKVALPEELVKRYGGDVNNISFGVKTINSPEELQRLQKDVQAAQKYFENAELHIVKDKNGKDVAVVMGVDAKDFNAVIAAERMKGQLTQAVEAAKSEMMQVSLPVPEKTAALDMDKMRKIAESLSATPSEATQQGKEVSHAEVISPLSVRNPNFTPDKGKGGIAA